MMLNNIDINHNIDNTTQKNVKQKLKSTLNTKLEND